jgi:hypothetical protein
VTGLEWVDSWTDALDLIPDVDTFVQGAGMYPGYAMFWSAIEADPTAVAPFSTRKPYEREVAYAQRAAKTPHYVLSTKLGAVDWPPSARIVRDLDALRALKEQPGRNIYVVGGPHLRHVIAQCRSARRADAARASAAARWWAIVVRRGEGLPQAEDDALRTDEGWTRVAGLPNLMKAEAT